MRVYLIDSDNVSIKQLVSEAHLLRNEDKIIIFYDDTRSENLKLKDYSILTNGGSRSIKFIEAYGGTDNALDFQLSSYMGFMIHESLINKSKDTEFIIITKDNGFKNLIRFWVSYGIKIKIKEHFSGAEKDCGSLDDITIDIAVDDKEDKDTEDMKDSTLDIEEVSNETEEYALDEVEDTIQEETEQVKEYNNKQFGKILDKEKYDHKTNGYHTCYLEKELTAIKKAKAKNPKNGVAEAIKVIRGVKTLDVEQIKFNSSKLKSFLVLDSGESYDVVGYIIYYSPTFEVMKANLYEWFVSLQTKKIKLIVENMADLVNVDVDRFEK